MNCQSRVLETNFRGLTLKEPSLQDRGQRVPGVQSSRKSFTRTICASLNQVVAVSNDPIPWVSKEVIANPWIQNSVRAVLIRLFRCG